MPSTVQHLARRSDLWWQFTVRAIEMRHRGSYLGAVWTVLNPLLMLTLYVSVFGLVFQNRFNAVPNETSVDYALAMFLGLILYHLVSETIAAAPTYVVAQPNLVKKVVFPLEILPVANTSALVFHFFISFVLLLVACTVSARSPSLDGLLWMPVLLFPVAMMTVGISWILSALGVFFRDISQVTGFVTQVVLWTSSVFFSVPSIQRVPALWNVLKWNPLLHVIEQTRRALLWQQTLDFRAVAYTWATGLAVALLGAWFFRKVKSGFADVI
jgi:lipopolysaccharide transport system permease protein